MMMRGCLTLKTNPLASILLNVSIAITDIETEIGDSHNTKPLNDDQLEQLDHDRITLINISNILTPIIKSGIESILKDTDLIIGDFYIFDPYFELETYNRALTENELIQVADFLGCKLYYPDTEEGINYWSNEESYDTEHYTRRPTNE
jgi:hypothetical protein